ncbi:MAG: CRISPR-associated endonuclease Cas1 [Sciscionella sp.]
MAGTGTFRVDASVGSRSGVVSGLPFHVAGSGCVLTRRGGRLVAFRDGALRASAPLTMVGEVIVSGRVTVTTAALHTLLANDIPLVLLTESGRPLGRLEPPGAPHIQARTRQLDLHRDPALRLSVGRQIVAGKIHNQGVLLRRRARRSRDPDAVWSAAARLAQLQDAVTDAADIPALLGMEGAAAGAYFGAIRSVLAPGYGFDTRDRARRDLVNMLINYCSALLRETVISALLCAGLDPYLSFLHNPSRGRPTLAFDLMEEWRPVLLESTVLALLGLGSATVEGLVSTPEGVSLSSELRSAAVHRLHSRLAAPARGWPSPSGSPSYGDLVRRQALRLRGMLVDGGDYEPFRWR